MKNLIIYDSMIPNIGAAIVNAEQIHKLPDREYKLVALNVEGKKLGEEEAFVGNIISQTMRLAERHSPNTIEIVLNGRIK